MQKENKKATVRVNVEHNPFAKSSKEYTLHGDWQDIEGGLELAFSSIKKSVNATPLCKVTLEYIPASGDSPTPTDSIDLKFQDISKELVSFKNAFAAHADILNDKIDFLSKSVDMFDRNINAKFEALRCDLYALISQVGAIRKAVESSTDKVEPSGNESEDLPKEEAPQEWDEILWSGLSKEEKERINAAFAKRVHALKTIGGRAAGKVEAMKALKREIKRLKSEMKSDL